MKAPLALTAVVLLVGLAWGWRQHGVTSALREQHRLVVREAEFLGVSNGSDASEGRSARNTRHPRENGGRGIQEFADQLVSFAKEMEESRKPGNQPDEAMQRRMMELIEGLLDLDGNDLKLLIGEMRSRTDMDDDMRKGMIALSIMMLSQDHPQTALAIFTESSDLLEDNGMLKHLTGSCLERWAHDQPLAAVKWMKQNATKHPELVNDDSKRSVISGIAANDFGLAFQLAGELDLDTNDDSLVPIMVMSADTPERREELLTAIRKQAAAMTDAQAATGLVQGAVRGIFSRVAESGFDQTMEWMNTAGLKPEESQSLAISLDYRNTKQDTGKWLDWIASQSSAGGTTEFTTTNLVGDWTRNDYKAAGDWLSHAPASPIKETAVMSYLETVAPYDPDVAAQWAETLSGERRVDALKRVRDALKQKDPAAAGEFTKAHGLPDK